MCDARLKPLSRAACSSPLLPTRRLINPSRPLSYLRAWQQSLPLSSVVLSSGRNAPSAHRNAQEYAVSTSAQRAHTPLFALMRLSITTGSYPAAIISIRVWVPMYLRPRPRSRPQFPRPPKGQQVHRQSLLRFPSQVDNRAYGVPPKRRATDLHWHMPAAK